MHLEVTWDFSVVSQWVLLNCPLSSAVPSQINSRGLATEIPKGMNRTCQDLSELRPPSCGFVSLDQKMTRVPTKGFSSCFSQEGKEIEKGDRTSSCLFQDTILYRKESNVTLWAENEAWTYLQASLTHLCTYMHMHTHTYMISGARRNCNTSVLHSPTAHTTKPKDKILYFTTQIPQRDYTLTSESHTLIERVFLTFASVGRRRAWPPKEGRGKHI